MGAKCCNPAKDVTSQRPPESPKGKKLIENLKLGKTAESFVRDFRNDYDVDMQNALGEGIQGPVYRATHRETGVEYAKKFLSTDALDAEQIDALTNELKIMSTLDHPNIVKLVEVFDTTSGFHMIQDLCTGGELLTRVHEQQRFPEAVARMHVTVMVEVIRYMHEKQIVHNDLKLENWLFEDENPNALLKLIDFGFSKIIQPNERLTGAQGSTMYMAPEMFTSTYDMQCDMWSIGVITFMLICGKPPFLKLAGGGVDFAGTKSLILSGEYTYPEDIEISDDAKDFIGQLLQIDPKKRKTAAEVYQHSWMQNGITAPQPLAQGIQDSLWEVKEMTQMQRTIRQVLAYLLRPEQLKDLREEFRKLDEKHNGEVTFEEFKSAVQKSNPNMSEDEIKKVFDSVDFDKSGLIHWNEFLAATIDVAVVDEWRLKKAFDRLDYDSSGKITVANLREIAGEDLSDDLSDSTFNAMLGDTELKESGKVDFDEFQHILKAARGRRLSSGEENLADALGLAPENVALLDTTTDGAKSMLTKRESDL